jgi:two-component sensor histidine kinase
VALVFGAALISDASHRARVEFEDRLRLLRNGIELRLANVIEDLAILARSPSLRERNFAEFREHAVEAVQLIGGIGIVVCDREGYELVNTRLPQGSALPRRTDFETMKRVLETGKVQVSDLNRAQSDRQAYIAIEAPVWIDGEIRYVVALGLSPAYLSELMETYVPKRHIASIADRKGMLIARRPTDTGADLVGVPVIPEIRAHIGEASAFWIKANSRSGASTFLSLLRSDQTGWTVSMSIPRRDVGGVFRRANVGFALLPIAALFASLAGALFVTNRFLKALTGLERHVVELATRRRILPEPGPVAEVNRMESVLHRVGIAISEAEDAVERERSLLRATVETMPIGVLLVTADGRISIVNRKLSSLASIDESEPVDAHGQFSYLFPDGSPYPPVKLPIIRALREGLTIEGEEVLHVAEDGAPRHEVLNAAPVRDDGGAIIAAVLACYDVTDVRTALRRQQILLDEINHRVKNTLATVQSIARLSMASASTVKDYATSLEQRLIALSGAYNLLTENHWEGADLRSIVERTLAPFAAVDRIRLSGRRLIVDPKLTLAMAAAIQELSTNAAKYGSLSTQAGELDVTWSRQRDGVIDFAWVERGGPKVEPPARRGFGTRLIRDILAAESGWEVTLDYAPEGLRCAIRIAPEQSGAVAPRADAAEAAETATPP